MEESVDFDHQIIPKIPIAVTHLGHHVAECHLQVNKFGRLPSSIEKSSETGIYKCRS